MNSGNPIPPKWRRVITEYRNDPTLENLLEILFKLKKRESCVKTEVYCGFIHFLSVCTVLAVNPSQLAQAGYDKQQAATATALACAASCILTGLLGNLPFVSTPSLSTSIYLSVFLSERGFSAACGNMIVMILGIIMILSSFRHVADSITLLTPVAIQRGICIGLALLVSLQALAHLGLVVQGKTTILTLGNMWTPQILISTAAFIFIGTCIHYRIKGAYYLGMFFGSICYWIYDPASLPVKLLAPVSLSLSLDMFTLRSSLSWICIFDLFLISSVLIAGLSGALSILAGLQRGDASIPRRRWLYFSCGCGTVIGGALGSGPVLLSVESAPGIIAGARTGLSSVVCGLLFLSALPFYPLWASIPHSGVLPVLLMVSVMLFENTGRVNWENTTEGIVVFITAIFSAFTYSILHGVVFGVSVFVVMNIFTGEFLGKLLRIRSAFMRQSIYSPLVDTTTNKASAMSAASTSSGDFVNVETGLGSRHHRSMSLPSTSRPFISLIVGNSGSSTSSSSGTGSSISAPPSPAGVSLSMMTTPSRYRMKSSRPTTAVTLPRDQISRTADQTQQRLGWLSRPDLDHQETISASQYSQKMSPEEILLETHRNEDGTSAANQSEPLLCAEYPALGKHFSVTTEMDPTDLPKRPAQSLSSPSYQAGASQLQQEEYGYVSVATLLSPLHNSNSDGALNSVGLEEKRYLFSNLVNLSSKLFSVVWGPSDTGDTPSPLRSARRRGSSSSKRRSHSSALPSPHTLLIPTPLTPLYSPTSLNDSD